MSDSITVDAARLPLLLGELRLPTVAKLWQTFTERADREGWPSARLLATLAEFELAERAQRRVQRHLLEARLPSGKTLDSFDFATVPMVSHAHVTALASGDAWLKKGANILLFGPSGSGKSHLGAALGHALVENGYRVLFTRTTDLVQRLQTARQALSLESAIDKLDKYHLIILDDLCYVNRDQAETSALFELIAARYERRSLLVTANRPFGEWTTVFPDAAMTLAAVDRLVHHAVILEMNVESYRQRSAAARQNRRATSDSKRDIKHKEATGHPNCRAKIGDAFLVYMLPPLPRCSGWAALFAHRTQPCQPSPIGLSGRPAHRPFRGLLGVHSRYGLHTRAATYFVTRFTEGFSHFVTSMTAPVASGWSGCRVGLAPAGKRRLFTAHTHCSTLGSARSRQTMPLRRGVVTLVGCMSLCGCFGLGTTRLYEDQLGYSRALGDAEKSDTLLNVVRLRYADTPIVLQATQVISGYQLQRNVTGGFEAFPAANLSTFLNGSASAQLQQSPTFTFQPLSGAQFAQSFVRPLSPADLLPLAMGGLPIDVLFRLGVQSVNRLSNAIALTQTGAAGSPDFFLLLQDLRRLQIAGLLGVKLRHNAARPDTHSNSDRGHVYFICRHDT